MGQALLRQFGTDNRSEPYFALIADEATDISHNEEMSLSIGIDSNYVTHEDTLGLVQLETTRAHQPYFSFIMDLLIQCSLSISQCRGQAFNGASNMSGIRNGVQNL